MTNPGHPRSVTAKTRKNERIRLAFLEVIEQCEMSDLSVNWLLAHCPTAHLIEIGRLIDPAPFIFFRRPRRRRGQPL